MTRSLLLAGLLLLLVACGDEDGGPRSASKQGWTELPSGVRYRVLARGGAGPTPTEGDRARIHMTVRVRLPGLPEEEGEHVVSDTREEDQPMQVLLGARRALPALEEVLARMTPGARWEVDVPSWLGHSPEEAMQHGVPPGADMRLDVELIDVVEGTLPRLPPSDPARRRTTPSGLVYEALVEGEGEPPGEDDVVTLGFAAFSEEGHFLADTSGMREPPQGPMASVRIGPEQPFVQEALRLMRPGARYRFEVPPHLGWQQAVPSPVWQPGMTTVWVLELRAVERR